MAFEAGSVFVRLLYKHDRQGAIEHDREVERLRRTKAIETRAGLHLDTGSVARYEAKVKAATDKAKTRAAFKAEMGGDFHPGAFNSWFRETEKARREARRPIVAHGRMQHEKVGFKSFDAAVLHSEQRAHRLRGALRTGAAVTGVSSLAFGLKSVTEEALKADAAERQLAVTIDHGGGHWARNGKAIEGNLTRLSLWSGIAKSDLSAAFANMFRTTGNLTKSWHLLGLAMDISRTRNIGMAEAQSLVARTANGSFRGLQRLGIAITPVTTNVDKLKGALQGSNKALAEKRAMLTPVTSAMDALRARTSHATTEELKNAKAQDHAATVREHLALTTGKGSTEELKAAKAADKHATSVAALSLIQTKFGGQAAAYAKSTPGQFEKARAALQQAQEEVGTVLLPLMTKLAQKVAEGAKWFRAHFKEIKASVLSVVRPIWDVTTAVTGFVSKHKAIRDMALAIVGVGLALRAVSFAGQITGVTRLIGLLRTGTARAGEMAVAEEVAAGGTGTVTGGRLSRLKGAIGGSIGRFGRGATIAAVGTVGSTLAGSAIGGRTGSTIGSIGSKVAAGAGIGMLLGPEGAIAGGILGGLVGGFSAFNKDRKAEKYGRQYADKLDSGLRKAGLHLPAPNVNTAAGKAAQSLRDKIAKDMADAHPKGTKAQNWLDDFYGIKKGLTKDQMDKAGRAALDLGRHTAQLFIQGQNSVKYHTAPAYIRQSEVALKDLPASGRKIAAQQMIEYARGLERNGRLPKGATNSLIRDITKKYGDLAPALKAAGSRSMHELDLSIRDRRVVNSVQRQIDRIGQIWGDEAPKLAKTGAGNARHNWQVEMDFLQRKIKTSTGQQRDDAKAAWRELQKQGEGTSAATRRAMARMADSMKKDTEFGATQMGRAAKSGFDYLGGQVNRGVGATKTGLGTIRTDLGHELKLFGAGSVTAKGFAAIGGKALGGWVGQPGRAGQDTVPIMAAEGEAVVNRHQMPHIEKALAFTRALGVGPHGSLAELFSREQRPHHMAKGGTVDGGPQRFAYGGVVAPVAALIRKLDSMGFQHGSTTSGGHAPGSYHYKGMAVDYGDASNNMSRLWSIVFPQRARFAELFGPSSLSPKPTMMHNGAGFSDAGLQAEHENHIHLALTGGALGKLSGGASGASSINTPKMPKGLGLIGRIGQAALNKAAGAANSKLQSTMGAMGGGGGQMLSQAWHGGGSLSGWLDQAMRLTGVHGGLWKQMLVRQAIRESSGNPNPGTIADINSAQGNPSEGLLQTTGSTFRANMLPGHGNILNPVDNAAAAIRYMIGTYGGGNPDRAAQVMWARGGGAYARGGFVGRPHARRHAPHHAPGLTFGTLFNSYDDKIAQNDVAIARASATPSTADDIAAYTARLALVTDRLKEKHAEERGLPREYRHDVARAKRTPREITRLTSELEHLKLHRPKTTTTYTDQVTQRLVGKGKNRHAVTHHKRIAHKHKKSDAVILQWKHRIDKLKERLKEMKAAGVAPFGVRTRATALNQELATLVQEQNSTRDTLAGLKQPTGATDYLTAGEKTELSGFQRELALGEADGNTDEQIKADTGIERVWENVLARVRNRPGVPADAITALAGEVTSARSNLQGVSGGSPAGLAQQAAEQLAVFSQNRADLFSQFGSNYRKAGQPTVAQDQTGFAAGTRAFGATSSGDSQSARPGTVVNLNVTHQEGPQDPHTWSRDVAWQMAGAMQ